MSDLCWCGQDADWHKRHSTRHKFDSGEEPVMIPPEELSPTITKGGDPVLRMALVHAGVITEEQITQATQWVDAAREHSKALVLLPDEEGKMQFHLVDLTEALTLKAGQ